ncbi:MAG: Jag N-terminal domain-containing protein [Clostridia bacterium]|nr:Jag N-terminal domain-containing protein [Clostridia bacterium]
MSETYLITAKTVEEAIAIANREYADQNHEVSYEILEMPKKGFLGIGAKEAKIKITVTKSVSAELDSLVSDIRGMKVMTSRGGEGKKQNPQKKQNEQKPQNDRPAQKQNPQKPQSEKPAQKQNPQKNDGQGEQKQKPQNNNQQKQQKPAQPKNEQQKPQSEKPAQKQNNQQKAEQKPQSEKPAQKPQSDKPAQKPVEKAPVKAEEPVRAEEAKSDTASRDLASRLDAAISSATTVDVTPRFGDVKAEYKSSLRNQAKPNKRAPQKASTGSGEKLGGGVTVSAPVGLTDFSAEEKTGFGYDESTGSGRINNDIRRNKKKTNAPKAEAKPEEAAEAAVSAETAEVSAPETSAPEKSGDGKSRNRRRRDRKKNERTRNENAGSANESAENVPAVPAEPAEQRKREPITQAEMDYALEFINTLLKNMGLGAQGVPAECPADEEFEPTEEAPVYPKINIIGDDTGILIGHHGETLDAIQYLVNLSALRKSKSKDGDYIKIVVDIENYREKREETLRQLARRMAARAVKYRRNVFLEPMNAYERRIIHSELQSFENVSTHSVGADRDRKIIITYEGPDKAPEKPRRRRGDKKPADVEMTAEVAEITYNNPEDYSAEEDNSSEVMEALEQAAVLVTDETAAGAGDGENRRPRKVQKMPIEKFTELLAASDSEPDEKPAFED